MPERTAETIAAELRELRPQKAALEARWKALREEFIKALGTRYSAGDVRLLAKRKFVFRPSVVAYLIETLTEEERAVTLRPVAEQIEKLYADGRLSLSGMHPHIEKIVMDTSLDFPLDRKKPERKQTDREGYAEVRRQ